MVLLFIYFFKKWPGRCVPVTEQSHFSACLEKHILFVIFINRISRCSRRVKSVQLRGHRVASLIVADVVLMALSGCDLHGLGVWYLPRVSFSEVMVLS